MSELPPRGTGLLTGRSDERQLGYPRTEEERLARHQTFTGGGGTFSNTEKVIVAVVGAVVGAVIALVLERVFRAT
ncbi:hypothetical protein ES703_123143 [subsurface metagenome]